MEGSTVVVALLVCALALAALWWLLHAPYRGVGAAFYAPGTRRRFLLTGCASGMGRHLTAVLLRQGHRVLATDVNAGGMRAAADADGWEVLAAQHGGALLQRALDVTARGQWEEAMAAVDAAWGGLDVCFNIAGYLMPKSIQDASARDIDAHVDVMVKGPMHGTQLAAALMARRGIRGHIVNVSSMAAVAPVAGVTLYAAAKCGCRGFSLAAAKDLAPLGIGVTCLMPDAVQTPMVEMQLHHDGGAYAFSGEILSLEDVARCVVETVLPHRPTEQWLSPRREVVGLCGLGGMFAGIIHSSRLVGFAERRMLAAGKARQRALLKKGA